MGWATAAGRHVGMADWTPSNDVHAWTVDAVDVADSAQVVAACHRERRTARGREAAAASGLG